MKKMLSILCVLAICTTVASADTTVWSGLTYDAVISTPVVIGSSTSLSSPTVARDLVQFTLTFVNTTGDAGGNPFNLDLGDAPPAPGTPVTGNGLYGELHQHSFFGATNSPTQDSPMADLFDTHLLLNAADLVSVMVPTEDANSTDPSDLVAVPVMVPALDTYMFGTQLRGVFTASAARPVGPLRTADWTLLNIVTFADAIDGDLANNIHFQGVIAGETLAETADFQISIPEPATMSLMAIGGIAALIRRRKA